MNVAESDWPSLPVPEGKRISLVMFSGGLDSTWTLVKLLRDTDDHVLAHRIDMLDNHGRFAEERKAAERVLAYCRENYRPFEISRSMIDQRGFNTQGIDNLSAGHEAGVIAGAFHRMTGHAIDRCLLGHAVEEVTPPERFGQASVICRLNCESGPAPEVEILPPVTKAEAASDLPYDLFRLVWYCRLPLRGEGDEILACGSCRTCERMADYVHPDAPAGAVREWAGSFAAREEVGRDGPRPDTPWSPSDRHPDAVSVFAYARTRPDPGRRNSLVMLDGGLQSVSLLVRLLRDTDDNVVAHYVAFPKKGSADKAALTAAKAISAWCRKAYRRFPLTVSMVDHRGLPASGRDIVSHGLQAGLVSGSYATATGTKIDRWVVSGGPAETGLPFPAGDAWTIARWNCLDPDAVPDIHEETLPSTEQLVPDLPREVFDMMWNCTGTDLAPGGFHGVLPCGKCAGCRRMAGVKHPAPPSRYGTGEVTATPAARVAQEADDGTPATDGPRG